MKYRLKDQEFQKKLDEISDGDFSRQMEGHLQDIRRCGTTDADYRVFFGQMSGQSELVNRFSMLLYGHEIEPVKEYDPNDWNSFPEVTPPEGVPMRVEAYFKVAKTMCKLCATFKDGNWYENDGQPINFYTTAEVKRFRPWE